MSNNQKGYITKKKNMNFQSVESLQSIVNVVNEAAAAVNDKKRTIRESAIPEVLAGALGAAIGGVGSFAALYGLGSVVGLSAAGITSGLAAAGGHRAGAEPSEPSDAHLRAQRSGAEPPKRADRRTDGRAVRPGRALPGAAGGRAVRLRREGGDGRGLSRPRRRRAVRGHGSGGP